MYNQSLQQVGSIILYIVNQGDNLYRIAQTYQSDVQWIKMMNNLNDDLIYPNQQLLIPYLYQQAKPVMSQKQPYDLYF